MAEGTSSPTDTTSASCGASLDSLPKDLTPAPTRGNVLYSNGFD